MLFLTAKVMADSENPPYRLKPNPSAEPNSSAENSQKPNNSAETGCQPNCPSQPNTGDDLIGQTSLER